MVEKLLTRTIKGINITLSDRTLSRSAQHVRTLSERVKKERWKYDQQ
jgi:hypothetical protein